MRVRELYDILFTEYPTLGFAPAIVTMALVVAVLATIVYGGVTVGKAFFAEKPASVTDHS